MKSKIKSTLIIFFDIKGNAHKKFVLAGQTVNSTNYLDISQRLSENMRRYRPEVWRQKNWLLHRDKAPSRTHQAVNFFFTKNIMTVYLHPAYFSLFLRLKIKLKGRQLDTAELIAAELQAVLKTLTAHNFQDAFKNGRSFGNGACSRKGTTSRVMVANKPKFSF
jgi:hypothetical protein